MKLMSGMNTKTLPYESVAFIMEEVCTVCGSSVYVLLLLCPTHIKHADSSYKHYKITTFMLNFAAPT